jgi:hypothetical protein
MLAFIGVLFAAHVSAQTTEPTKGFVNVSFAAQFQSRSFTTTQTFPVFGETATIVAKQEVGGGPLFDISAGYRLRPRFAVGIGFSSFGDSATAEVTATIPSPIAINRPTTITLTSSGLDHSEFATHIMALYFLPVTETVDVAFFIGPSIFNVSQEIATGSVTGTTPNIAPIEESATSAGFNVGVDVTYLFRRNYGVGAFLRYAGASVDLPSIPDLSVGGFHLGIGGRLRF